MNINPTHLSSQMRFMRQFDSSEVRGLQVNMNTTNPMHISDSPQAGATRQNGDAVQSFANLLQSFIGSVNSDQVESTRLQQLAVTNPEKVNIHQVTAAMSKAEMSLGFIKAVSDRVINGFREINNLR